MGLDAPVALIALVALIAQVPLLALSALVALIALVVLMVLLALSALVALVVTTMARTGVWRYQEQKACVELLAVVDSPYFRSGSVVSTCLIFSLAETPQFLV